MDVDGIHKHNTAFIATPRCAKAFLRRRPSSSSWICPLPMSSNQASDDSDGGGWIVAMGRARRRMLSGSFPTIALSHARAMESRNQSQRELRPSEGRIVEISLGKGVSGGQKQRVAEILRKVEEKKNGMSCWEVVDGDGEHFIAALKDIKFILPGDQGDIANDLHGFQRAATELMPDESVIRRVWETIHEEQAPVDILEFSSRALSDTAPTALYAAHLALSRHDIYFTQRKGKIIARSKLKVEERIAAAEVAKRRLLKVEKTTRVLQTAREIKEWPTAPGDIDVADSLFALEELARQGSGQYRESTKWYMDQTFFNTEQRAVLSNVLEILEVPTTPLGALTVLMDSGRNMATFNVFIENSELKPLVFDEKVVEMARKIAESEPDDPDAGSRVDLTHLRTFAIDAAGSVEIDDAISIESETDKARVHVHIADPLRWLSEDDPVFLEAIRRGSSAYLATGILPMMPPELSSQRFSLGREKYMNYPAITVSFDVQETGSIENFEVFSSVVRVTDTMTYDCVDDLLSSGATRELLHLNELAELREEYRVLRGATVVSLPELELNAGFSRDGDMEFTSSLITHKTSLSRRLVSEMMIAACEAAGRFCINNDIKVPFRCQEMRNEPSPQEIIRAPEGYARENLKLRRMRPVVVRQDPLPHASIGLDSYCQVTSPLRRGVDLVAHMQLKKWMRGESGLGEKALWRLVHTASVGSKEMRFIETRTNLYWLLEYIADCGLDQVYNGVMLAPQRHMSRVAFIPDLGHRFDIENGDRLATGKEIMCQFTVVEPLRLRASLSVVQADGQS